MKIWILNHYATNMYFDGGGRHHWFAKYLIREGHEVEIFCSNQKHNSSENIDTGKSLFVEKIGKDSVPYTFVKTPTYEGNGLSRIENMIAFWKNVKKVCKLQAEREGKPDVILASSVHPLTLVAGLKLGKAFSVPCICEVRDLWPESIVEYTSLSKNNLVIKYLYMLEKWIYWKADRLVFTFEGGKDYIIDKKWDLEQGGKIDLNKVRYINNGIDLEDFRANLYNNIYYDDVLENSKNYNIIYTGSIRKVNGVEMIVDAAKLFLQRGVHNVKFMIYGDGTERAFLEKKAEDYGVDNIFFRGRVEKKYIPSILSKAYINVFVGKDDAVNKYGLSLNKLFDYMAAGKPIIANIESNYDNIKKYDCGKIVENNSPEAIYEAVVYFMNLDEDNYNRHCNNAKIAAKDFDFKVLTEKLEEIIHEIVKE